MNPGVVLLIAVILLFLTFGMAIYVSIGQQNQRAKERNEIKTNKERKYVVIEGHISETRKFEEEIASFVAEGWLCQGGTSENRGVLLQSMYRSEAQTKDFLARRGNERRRDAGGVP